MAYEFPCVLLLLLLLHARCCWAEDTHSNTPSHEHQERELLGNRLGPRMESEDPPQTLHASNRNCLKSAVFFDSSPVIREVCVQQLSVPLV